MQAKIRTLQGILLVYSPAHSTLPMVLCTGVGTLEISGGIYNTAVSSRKTVGGNTQISLLVKRRRWVVWCSHTHFREGVATPDYNIICVGGERAFIFNSQRGEYTRMHKLERYGKIL